MTPRNRRPKPTKAAQQAALDLVRPLQFPTRASWDAYLEQREQEREELRRLQVPEESVEAILGELETPEQP